MAKGPGVEEVREARYHRCCTCKERVLCDRSVMVIKAHVRQNRRLAIENHNVSIAGDRIKMKMMWHKMRNLECLFRDF